MIAKLAPRRHQGGTWVMVFVCAWSWLAPIPGRLAQATVSPETVPELEMAIESVPSAGLLEEKENR